MTNTFTDISNSDWYFNDVKIVYELDLLSGKGAGIFDAKGNLTIAEALSIAARGEYFFRGYKEGHKFSSERLYKF